ncbi:hypothetical protein GC163_03195 [bacterium]|nr:hypothetical protein [bacterium]
MPVLPAILNILLGKMLKQSIVQLPFLLTPSMCSTYMIQRNIDRQPLPDTQHATAGHYHRSSHLLGGSIMARQDALVRLHHRLVAQRDDLRRKLSEDMDLTYAHDDGINDIGETASQVEQSELHSQLAALESRELAQIEQAIHKMHTGTYGYCDRCEKAIPIARLQALPFSSRCITCQRKSERRSTEEEFEANWASAMEYERRSNDRELNLSDIDVG